MCFSAEASFTGAVLLGTATILNIFKIRGRWLLLWLALVPLFFAFQQLNEGFLWLSIGSGRIFSHSTSIEKYVFLFFALFFWPVWIPLCLFIPEQINWRKKVLGALLTAGILYDLILLYTFSTIWPNQHVGVQIVGHSIQYMLPIEHNIPLGALYGLVTIFPPFFSSLKYAWLLGQANIIGFAVAYYFYYEAYVSVWCFFAAWISLCIYFVLSHSAEDVKILSSK